MRKHAFFSFSYTLIRMLEIIIDSNSNFMSKHRTRKIWVKFWWNVDSKYMVPTEHCLQIYPCEGEFNFTKGHNLSPER